MIFLNNWEFLSVQHSKLGMMTFFSFLRSVFVVIEIMTLEYKAFYTVARTWKLSVISIGNSCHIVLTGQIWSQLVSPCLAVSEISEISSDYEEITMSKGVKTQDKTNKNYQ